MQGQSHGVGLRKVGVGDCLSLFIIGLSTVPVCLKMLFIRKLAKVAVEISDHLLEEDDGFSPLDVMLVGYDLRLDNFDDVMASSDQFLRNIVSGTIKGIEDRFPFLGFTLDSLDNFQLSPSRCNNTFVG